MRKQDIAWIALVAASLFLLTTTMARADEGRPRFGTSAGNGLVILSVTVAAKLAKDSPEIDLLYRRVYSAATATLPVNYGHYLNPLYPIIDNGQRLGNLAVLDLPAGNYEFYARRSAKWHPGPVISGTYPFAHWTDTSSVEHFPIRFNVAAGRLTYAGNLILSATDSGSAEILVEDRRARDISLYLMKNPDVAPASIRHKTMQ